MSGRGEVLIRNFKVRSVVPRCREGKEGKEANAATKRHEAAATREEEEERTTIWVE